MKKKVLAVMMLAVLAGAPATARAEMPDYDTAGYCQAVASFGGVPSEMIRNGCLQQEQAAYNELKSTWDALPATLRAHCNQVARFTGPGSFMLLKGCVDQELDAAQQNQQFKFQR